MNMEIPLMGLAVYILVWDKLPHWGTWFQWILDRLPGPLRRLYDDWRCPYCFGFWVALGLHAVTGRPFLPELDVLAGAPDILSVSVTWFLDALAAATVIYAAKIGLDAIGLPAMKGVMMKAEFMKSMGQK